MQAHTRSIFALFDGKRRYVIPLFQRQYVWTKDRQWHPLWEDVRAKAEEVLDQRVDRPPHFLGAIVINQLRVWGDQVSAAKVEMVLLALDHALRTKKGESITIDDELTIEHIMPQQWEEHWPLPANDPSGIARDKVIHTFGNLTLLTQGLNTSVSNGPYVTKRPEITAQSALRLNASFQSVEAWDETAIGARNKALFELALKVWPRPTTS